MSRTTTLLAVLALAAAGVGAAAWLLLRPDGRPSRGPGPDARTGEDAPAAPGPAEGGAAAGKGSAAPEAPDEPFDPEDESDLDRAPHGPEGGATADEILAALARGDAQGWLEAARLLSIAGTDDPRVTDALLKALADGRFRNRAAELAAHLKDPAALGKFLAVATGDGDPGTRAVALLACAHMGGPGVLEAATEALRSDKGGSMLSNAAALALGVLGTPDAARVLVESLREAVGTSRQAALAEALSKIDDADSLAEVARLASDAGVDGRMRAALVEAMGRSRNPAVVPDLLRIARSDADPSLKADAYRALARIGTAEAVEELMNALHGGDDGMKMEAAMALREVQGKGAAPMLEKAAEGAVPQELRGYVVEALGRTGSASSVPVLGRIAGDADEPQGLRITALRAIASIGDPSGAAVAFSVLETSKREDAPLRQAALGVLAGSVAASDLPRLERLLQDAAPKTPEWFHLDGLVRRLKTKAP
jgi:HEAT repeat protein